MRLIITSALALLASDHIALAQIRPLYAVTLPSTAEGIDSIGDLNGDTYRDILVGHANLKRINVHNGTNGTQMGTFSLPASTAFGGTVISAPDFTGDGIDDIVAADVALGKVYLLKGGINPTLLQSWTSPGAGANAAYGKSVAVLKTNAAGLIRVCVGAPLYSPNAANPSVGLVEVFNVSTPVTTTSARTLVSTLVGVCTYRQFGWSMDNAGKLQGALDPFEDLVVGGYYIWNPPSTCGTVNRAYVFDGATLSQGINASGVTLFGANHLDLFGASVARGGDITGDGIGDVVIGVPWHNPPGIGSGGASKLYSGAALAAAFAPNWAGVAPLPVYTHAPMVGCSQPACLDVGWSVSRVGDYNLDGRADWLVGAPDITAGVQVSGMAFIVSGLTGATNQSVAAPLGVPSEEYFGELVSELGKVDTSTRQRFMVLRNHFSPSGAHRLYVY